LTVYCDRATLQRNYAFFGRLREWAGVPPGARVATFAGRTVVPAAQARPPFWRVNAAANNWLFSSYHISAATLPWYVDALRRVQPEHIHCPAHSRAHLALYLGSRHRGHPPQNDYHLVGDPHVRGARAPGEGVRLP